LSFSTAQWDSQAHCYSNSKASLSLPFRNQAPMKKSYISNLRVLATFSVVLLHSAGAHLLQFHQLQLDVWNVANLFDSFTRFAVPVFVMISGAVLLGRDEDLGTFTRKRISRLLIPFIFWSLLYATLKYYSILSEFSFWKSAKLIITDASLGSAIHLWYLFMIIGLYLIIPILRKWTVLYRENEIRYFLAIWVATVVIGFFQIGLLQKVNFTYFTGFIGYLVLGYYLDRVVIRHTKMFTVMSLGFITLGAVTIAFLSRQESLANNEIVYKYYGYMTPLLMITAIGWFILFRLIATRTNKFIESIDQHSFGIYLVHILILGTVKNNIRPEAFQSTPFMICIYIFMIALVTFFASYAFCLIVKKIPYVNKLIG
jgi:surface polysaccharide O-acyltransferase-like enzyme